MKSYTFTTQHLISQISPVSWKTELDKASARYHVTACWIAIIFDPIFAVTDYINIPESWQLLLIVRLSVSAVILLTLMLKNKLHLSTHAVVSVPFILISLQNAFTYRLIGQEDLLGHNLNYMALLVGAAMFVLWHWTYSVIIVVLSTIATTFFLTFNRAIEAQEFFLKGGLLLMVVAVFMIVLIQTRYTLTVREIKARLALQLSNEEIQAQAEEIQVINENLETLVKKRTEELEQKNRALEEAAFFNAHKLRSPVASILGLINLLRKTELNREGQSIMEHMADSAHKLDTIVGSIAKAIEQGDSQPEKKDKTNS
jgi:signal transduction histidine kinase